MTSGSTFPNRLTSIDDLTLPDHRYLSDSDDCYFIGEYTARTGYAYSPTNSLILNFKKPMDRHGRPEWHHKELAIQKAAAAFRRALNPGALDRLTFVPIPPSKAKEDPLYDNRLIKMLFAIRGEPPLDIREIVVQTRSTSATHDQEVRPGPNKIEELYRIDETLMKPAPSYIAVVDDLLTTGAHFRATKSILSARFPEVAVVGLFIARRVPNTSDPDDFND